MGQVMAALITAFAIGILVVVGQLIFSKYGMSGKNPSRLRKNPIIAAPKQPL
jgi:hypothetical protein